MSIVYSLQSPVYRLQTLDKKPLPVPVPAPVPLPLPSVTRN